MNAQPKVLEMPAVPPKPEEIDELAEKYERARTDFLQATLAMAEANKPIGPLKEQILALIEKFGSVHAEKSKILRGLIWEAMGTWGQSQSLDHAAVETFRLALVKAKQSRLLKKIFVAETRWKLAPEASAIVKSTKLAPKLLALFAQCSVTAAIAPRLKVEKQKKATVS
jgi:hypothetical protein